MACSSESAGSNLCNSRSTFATCVRSSERRSFSAFSIFSSSFMSRCIQIALKRVVPINYPVAPVPRSNRQNTALVQCRVSVGGAPSNLRIVSGGIPSLPAISSGVGSRPITCRRFRQVRRILFKTSMVATDKRPSIIIPRSLSQNMASPAAICKLQGSPPAAPITGYQRPQHRSGF
jgi:hypothetical protein